MPTTSSTPEQARDLGVAWMNRGHALQQVGDLANLAAALNAYGEAVTLLEPLPFAKNPSWANSLGAALMNHGQLLHRAYGTGRAREVLASLDRAIDILRRTPCDENPWPRRNLAGSHLNRASILLDLARPAEARADARVALQLAVPNERVDLIDADLALKSRRALCDVLGQLMVETGADQDSLAREASDLVDDGLALARHWIQRGAPQPRELARRLFRFGAQLYCLHQPQFLGEFLLENLDRTQQDGPFANDPEFRTIANDTLARARRAIDRPRLWQAGEPETEALLRFSVELTGIEQHLAALPTNAPIS